MKTYIGKNSFQFITDFSKHAMVDSNGNAKELDFGSLTIYERIILSVYLTLLTNDKNRQEKENWYDAIFNFNSKKNWKTSYHDAFISDLSTMLDKNPHYLTFIKDNFDKIENDKTFIYRQQLNASEMEVLYSMKFQRSYKSLMNVLYIMGVAKQNIVTRQLNHISFNSFRPTTSKCVKEKIFKNIFDKLSKACGREIEYRIEKDTVWFKNGFGIELKEEFYSEDKKEFEKQQDINNWLMAEVKEKPNKPVINAVKAAPKKVEPKKVEPIKHDALNIGDAHLTIEDIAEYSEVHYEDIFNNSTIYQRGTPENKCICKINELILSEISNSKEAKKLLNGEHFNGDDWKEKKDTARFQIKNIQNKTIKLLEDIYDIDKNLYKVALNFTLRNHTKLFLGDI